MQPAQVNLSIVDSVHYFIHSIARFHSGVICQSASTLNVKTCSCQVLNIFLLIYFMKTFC